MLREIDIRDMLLIDRLVLPFGPGLNALTGETGAGKSILLDCLGFVLGWRGPADLVRAGAAQGEVTAVFDLPPGHPARAALEQAGLPAGDELILRRVNAADGRKTGWINDRRVSGEVLRAVSDSLVELHGQHDDRGLLNPRGHRAMLDAFAGADDALAQVRAAWSALAGARKAEDQARAALDRARADEEFLRHAVAELTDLSPEPGEDAALDARRRQMQAAARIREDVTRAAQALGDDGAGAMLRDATRWLEGAADRAEGALDAALAALSRASIELAEAADGVDRAAQAMDFDPRELDRVEERLFALRALARKHGVLPDDLAQTAAGLADRLAAIDGGAEGLAGHAAAVATAAAAYDAAAARLSALRADAAGRLDAAVSAELAPLKMERAVFTTQITPAEPGPDGAETVAFSVATNPGAPAGPLDKIASGGELSRFLLALKVCLARGNDALVMIFDEIDRGVGGATADAVGRRLKALADTAQVLVVTHSPQVAARADHHFRVEKRVVDGVTVSSVARLDADQSTDELARMLAGDTVTDAARAAARALREG
ncbi:DNA repair protein RecN [Paracoccus sp. p3-h83]|uniref:DNA repair protein RecN n=1 Tax=Paracoccus sp. p3-h83 TaxID=3342805 RepID=UPI0035BA5B06